MSISKMKFFIAEQAHNYLQSKVRLPKNEKCPGCDPVTYYTYKVEVALFGEDFHAAPTIHEVDVRLTDAEYLRLLQWQIHNPNMGYNGCDADLSDIMGAIEAEVEMTLFPDDVVGTYAVNLTEIKQDAEEVVKRMCE